MPWSHSIEPVERERYLNLNFLLYSAYRQGYVPPFRPDIMMYIQPPHRLFPDEHPSIARLVQLVLCEDRWARIDAYRVCSFFGCLFGP